MPLGRHAIHNEYGLAAPELYRNCGEENPEALLEGLAMAGMVGLLRQLGDLAEFAADIFHDLQEEVMGTAGRTHELLLRVQEMEAELPAAEKFLFTEAHHLNFAYAPGKELHMIDYSHENIYSQGDLPRFVRNSYKECRGPPRLFPLDRFDISGDGACLKRYTNPSFVKVEWANSAISRTEREQITKKARRNRNRHRHRMNLDMKARKSLSLIQARVQQSSSDRQDIVGVFNALKSNPVLEEQSEKPNVCFNQGKIGIQSTIQDSDSLGVGRAFRNGIYRMDKQIIPSEPLRISAKELETASTRFFKKEMTGAFPQSNGDSGLNSKGRGILSMASKSVTLSELLKLSDKNDFGHGNDSVPYYWHPPLTCNGNTSLNEKREMQTKGGLSKSTENGSKNMNSEVPDNNCNDTICDEDHFVDAPKLDEKREMETKGGLRKSMENGSKNMNSEVPDSNCNDAICDEDHFVDALNTMESEGETSKSKEKEEADNFSIRMNSEVHTNGLILSETVNGSEKAVSDPKNSNGVADEREAGQVSSTLFPEIDNSSVKLNSEVETDGYILSELGNGLVRVKKSKSVSDLSDLDKNSNGSANEREAKHLSFVLSEVDNSLIKMNSELDKNGLTISETFNGEFKFENSVTDMKNNNGSVNEREVEPLSSVLFGVDNSDHFSLEINLEDHTDDPIFLKTDNGSVQMMEADLDLPVLDKNSDASDLDTDVDGRFKEGKMDSPTTIMDWHMDEGFNQVSDEKKRSLKEFEDPQGKPLEFHSKAREEDENDEDDDEDSLGVMQVSSGSTSPSSSSVLGPIKSSSFDDVPCVSENDLQLCYFESLLHSSASSGRNSSVSQSTVVILDSNLDLPLERESSEAFTSCFSQLESQFGYEILERNSHECGGQSPRLSTSLSHDLLLQATQEWSANNTLSCEKTIEIHDRDADLSAPNCDRISAVVLPLDFKQDVEMPLVTSEPCLLVLETTNLQSVNNIGIDQGVQACSSPLKGEGLCIDPARKFPDLISSAALDSTQDIPPPEEISVIPLQTTSVPSYDAIAPHSAQILEHLLPSFEVIQMDCTRPIALSSDLTTLAFIESRVHPEFRSSSSQCSEEISEGEPSPPLSPLIHQIRESPITCTPLSKQSMEHLPPCLQHSEETAMDHIQPSNLSANHEPILAFIERMDPAPPLSPSLSLQTRESPISCTSLLEQSMERLLPSLKHSEETVMDYNIHPADLSSDSEHTLTFIESRDSYPPSSPPFSPQIRESPTTCTPLSKQNIEPILLSLLHPEETVMDHNIHPTDHSSNPEFTLDFIESKDPYPPLSFPFSPQSREAPITCTPLLKQSMDPILPSLQHSEEKEMDHAHPIALSCTSESASAFIESRDPSPHLPTSCSLQTRESSIASSMLSKQSMDQPFLPSLQNSEETLMDHNIHLIDLSSNSEPAPDFIESRHPSPSLSPSFSPEIRESPIACTSLPKQSMDPLPPSLPHSEETVMDHTCPIALSCNSLEIPFIESREINPEFHASSLQSLEEISTEDPSSSLSPSYSVQNKESSNAYTPPLQQIMEPPVTSSEEMLMGCGLPLVPSCNLTTSSSQCQEEISVYPSSPLSPSYSVQTRESPDAFSPLLTVAIDSILSSSSPSSFHPDLTQTVNSLGLNADLSRDVEAPLISPTGPSDNFLVVSTKNSELLEELDREEPQIKQSADAFTPLLEVAIDPILFSSPSEFHPDFTQTVNSVGLNANLSPDVEADLINPSGLPDNFLLVSTENSRILEELDKEELFGDLTNLPDACKSLLQNREEEMVDSIEDASVSSTQVLDIPQPILHTEKIESLEEASVDPNGLSKTLPEISNQDMEPLREEISEDHTAPSTAINNSIFVSTDTTETPNTIIADNIHPSAFSNDSLFSPTQTDKLLELNVADNSEVFASLSRFSSPLQHEQEILEDSTRASDIVKIPLLVVEPIIDSPTLDQHSSECAEETMANDSNHSVLFPPFRNVEEIIFDTTDVSALSNPLPLVTTQIREPSNSQSAPLECVEPRAMNYFQSSPHSKNFEELSTGPLQCPESLFINSDDNHSTLDPNMSSSLLSDSQPDSSFSIQPHDIHAHMLQNSEEDSSLIKSTHPLNPLVDFDYPLATEHLSLAQPSACRNAESTSNELLDLESTPAESVSSSFKISTQANHTVDYPELSIKHGRILPNSLAFAEPEQIERMNSLIEAIASHDRSKLRKVTDVPHVPRPRPLTDREKLLEQIKSCAFKLRPTVVEKHACPHSAPSNNVAAILEKVNAIRQAFAGSDEDSDFSDDDWN